MYSIFVHVFAPASSSTIVWCEMATDLGDKTTEELIEIISAKDKSLATLKERTKGALEALKNEVKEKDDKIQDQYSKLKRAKDMVTSASSEKAKFSETIDNIQKENDILKQENETLKLKSSTQNIDKKDEEENITKEIEELKLLNENLKHEIDTLNMNHNHEKQIIENELKNKIIFLENQIIEKNNLYENEKSIKQEINEELDYIKEENKTLEEDKNKNISVLKEIQFKNNERIENYEKEIKNLNNSINEINESNQKLIIEKEHLNETNSKQFQIINDLKLKFEKEKSEILEKQNENHINFQNEENEKILIEKEKNEKLLKKIEELNKEKEEIEINLKNNIENQNNEIKLKLQNEIETLKMEIENMNQLQLQLQEEEKRNKEKEKDTNDNILKEKIEIEKKLETVTNQLFESEQNYQELKQIVENNEKNNHENHQNEILIQKDEEITQNKLALINKENEINELKMEMDSIKQTSVKNDNNSKHNDINKEQIQNELIDKNNEIAILSTATENAEQQVKELTNELTELNLKFKTQEDMRKELETLQEKTLGDYNQSKADIVLLNDQIAKLKESNNELILEHQSELATCKNAEKNAVDRLNTFQEAEREQSEARMLATEAGATITSQLEKSVAKLKMTVTEKEDEILKLQTSLEGSEANRLAAVKEAEMSKTEAELKQEASDEKQNELVKAHELALTSLKEMQEKEKKDLLEVQAGEATKKFDEASVGWKKAKDEQERSVAELQGKLKRLEQSLEDEKTSAAERKKQVIAHVSNLNEDKKKLTLQLGRAKQLLEEAQRREIELKEALAAEKSLVSSSSQDLLTRIAALEETATTTAAKHAEELKALQSGQEGLATALQEVNHHKGKRAVAKTEMIALAQALEAERELRRTVISHVANSATPKVSELSSTLETELRKMETNLISLSAKCSRPWAGQSSIGGPGAVVMVGQSNSPASIGMIRSASGNERKSMLKDAEGAQFEMLGSLQSQMARLSAGLSNLSSAIDLLTELTEQQTLNNIMKSTCSKLLQSCIASTSSESVNQRGGGGRGGGGSIRGGAGGGLRRTGSGSGGGRKPGRYEKLPPVLTSPNPLHHSGSGSESSYSEDDSPKAKIELSNSSNSLSSANSDFEDINLSNHNKSLPLRKPSGLHSPKEKIVRLGQNSHSSSSSSHQTTTSSSTSVNDSDLSQAIENALNDSISSPTSPYPPGGVNYVNGHSPSVLK